MFKELEAVVLTHAIPKHGLRKGDIGAVVHRYQDGAAYEVEFVRGDGTTVAVVTLTERDLRLLADTEILHARAVVPSGDR